MTELRIGLVVEGPTDFVVLTNLLTSYFAGTRSNLVVKFIDLQPSMDGTTGSTEGGWELVYQWCLRNPSTLRRQRFLGAGLFAYDLGAKTCDLIVVVMDADILDFLSDKAPNVPLPVNPLGPVERGNYVRAVLEAWLWENDVLRDDKHIATPAVERIETWLMTGLSNSCSGESETNPSYRLAEAYYQHLNKPLPRNIRALRKTTARYEQVAAVACRRIGAIKSTCGWFSDLLDRVELHVDAAVQQDAACKTKSSR